VHMAGPDQQRVRRIGRSLVAVAAALDDQAQVIFAREIDGRGDVLGASCGDNVRAWLGSPRVEPSRVSVRPGVSPM
jgi:hypothetical protein